jgi:hypothetical protein
MAIGKGSKVYLEVSNNIKGLTMGVVVAIDPSVGSSSSMPGWAVYRVGVLVESGIISLPREKALVPRLRALARSMRDIYRKYLPDVLVYEEIPAQRHGMGNAEAHASLLKAVGVILSIEGPEAAVGIYPVSWKGMVSDHYIKGDEEDAREIGRIVIEHAFLQQQQTTATKKKGKKK